MVYLDVAQFTKQLDRWCTRFALFAHYKQARLMAVQLKLSTTVVQGVTDDDDGGGVT